MKTILSKLKIVLIGFVVVIAWNYTITPVIDFFYGSDFFGEEHVDNLKHYLFFICLLTPIFEELKYRILPLTFVSFFDKDNQLLWPAIVFSSIIFGSAHGYGVISIMVQGVHGFIFSNVYIRTNRTFWCPMLLHSLYNISCIFLY